MANIIYRYFHVCDFKTHKIKTVFGQMVSTYQFVINVAIGLKYILGKSRLVTCVQLTVRCCLKYVCTQSPKNLLALLIGIHSPDIYQLKKKNTFNRFSVLCEILDDLKLSYVICGLSILPVVPLGFFFFLLPCFF